MARLGGENLNVNGYIEFEMMEILPFPFCALSRKFLIWALNQIFDLNPRYARKLRGILNIIHLFLSMLTLAIFRSACQETPFNESGCRGFYCESSNVLFITNSCYSSLLCVWCILKTTKTLTGVFSTSFFLSLLTFAIIRSASQMSNEIGSCGFYCNSSYTYHFVSTSVGWSVHFLLWGLLSKKSETKFFRTSFKKRHYIGLYFFFLVTTSVALIIKSWNMDRSQKEEEPNSTFEAAKELATEETWFKVFQGILGKAVLMSVAIYGGIRLGVNMLGFRAGGVTAGSLAATYQSSVFSNFTDSRGMFATLQRVGAAGLATSTKFFVIAGSATAAILEAIFN